MPDIHIRLSEIAGFMVALATTINALCGAAATLLGAINHRRIHQLKAGQLRIEEAVNGRVEELANAKASQVLLKAVVASNPGGVVIRSEGPREEQNIHVE